MTEKFNPATAQALIRIENLHKDFGSLKVLSGISETIYKGEVVSLICHRHPTHSSTPYPMQQPN